MAENKKPYEIDTSILEKKEIGIAVNGDIDTVRKAMIYYNGRKMKTEFGEKELYKIKGGGWIENERNLSQSGECWIEEGAIVCGYARVTEDAVIRNGAQVGDDATVSGKAVVEGKSIVGGYARIRGHVESSKVDRSARVMDGAEVLGGSEVTNGATVFGTVEGSTIGGSSTIYGEAKEGCVVCGKSSVVDGASVVGPYVVSGCRVLGKIGKPADDEEADG